MVSAFYKTIDETIQEKLRIWKGEIPKIHWNSKNIKTPTDVLKFARQRNINVLYLWRIKNEQKNRFVWCSARVHIAILSLLRRTYGTSTYVWWRERERNKESLFNNWQVGQTVTFVVERKRKNFTNLTILSRIIISIIQSNNNEDRILFSRHCRIGFRLAPASKPAFR